MKRRQEAKGKAQKEIESGNGAKLGRRTKSPTLDFDVFLLPFAFCVLPFMAGQPE
jgi:hypothetical protein